MSEERLEEVIELMCESYHDYLVADNIKRSEVRYKSYLDCKEIIKSEFEKQAERVEEYRSSLEHGAMVAVKTAEKLHHQQRENKRYREALEEVLKIVRPNILSSPECSDIEVVLRKALEESK